MTASDDLVTGQSQFLVVNVE